MIVINPGCNYPIPVDDISKDFAKKIYADLTKINYYFKIRRKKVIKIF